MKLGRTLLGQPPYRERPLSNPALCPLKLGSEIVCYLWLMTRMTLARLPIVDAALTATTPAYYNSV